MRLSLNMLFDFLADNEFDYLLDTRDAHAMHFESVRLASGLEDGLEPLRLHILAGSDDAMLKLVIMGERGADGRCQQSVVSVRGTQSEDVANKLIEWVALMDAWERGMELAIARGLDDQTLIDLSEELLKLPMAVSGPLYDAYAWTHRYRANDRFFQEIVHRGSLSPESVKLLEDQHVFGNIAQDRRVKVFGPSEHIETWHMNRHFRKHGSRVVFVTAWCPAGKPTPGQVECFDFFCDCVRRLHETQVQNGTAHFELRESALGGLLEGDEVDEGRACEILEIAGIPRYPIWRLGVIDCNGNANNPKTYFAHSLSSQIEGGWAFVHDGCTVVLLGAESAASLQLAVGKANEMTQTAHASMGMSFPFVSPRLARAAFGQACFALKTGAAISEARVLERRYEIMRIYDENIFEYANYSPHYIARTYKEGFESGVAAVLRLAARDLHNGTRKLRVLHAYLSVGCNAQKAASQLGMHRNSVSYQVRAIENMLGRKLSDPRTVYDAVLAFAVLEMRNLGECG